MVFQVVSLGLLAAVHLIAHRLKFLDVVPRSRWLSFAGGVSTAYVFIHLLPELAAHQERIEGRVQTAEIATADVHVYLLTLLGLAIFYGLERVAKRTRRDETGPPPGVYWLHLSSFAIYNTVIGYLLRHGEVATEGNVLVYAGAMALHFFVNDYGLRRHYAERYRRTGRWILSLSVVAGFVLALAVRLPELVTIVIVAVLGGGIILNVLKEELPEERESRFWPFAVGGAGYATLLVMV